MTDLPGLFKIRSSYKPTADIETFIGDPGDLFYDVNTRQLRISDGETSGGITISNGGGGGGASTFRQLSDTPNTFTGSGGRFVKVNAQATALEFVDVSIFDGNYNNLTNKPVLFDGAYSSLSGRPTLFSGSYNDLSNKPTLFSGSYNDLSNKPTLFNPSLITTSLVPTTNAALDLGTNANKWRDLYLSGTTISLGDAVIRNVEGTVELPANAKVAGKKIPTDVRDLDDVDNLLSGNYILPTASATVKGGVKIGSGLAMSESGVVSVTSVPGESSAPIKTFNIIGEFSAPLLGKAIFVPAQSDIIRSVILTNSSIVASDLMVGLYRNNELLNFFTIPSGYFTYTYSNLNFVLNTNDYITVNVVAGSGSIFSMSLYNFNI
jgi:hypothetical protein